MDWSVRKIIEACGGVSRIADATGQSVSAVHKWAANGIPEKHWATLMGLSSGLDALTLHTANEETRRRAAPAEPKPEAA